MGGIRTHVLPTPNGACSLASPLVNFVAMVGFEPTEDTTEYPHPIPSRIASTTRSHHGCRVGQIRTDVLHVPNMAR